jgi:hypothetical protein
MDCTVERALDQLIRACARDQIAVPTSAFLRSERIHCAIICLAVDTS